MVAIPITTSMVHAAFDATAKQTEPSNGAQFQAGDFVVYPTHGVGKVDRVGAQEIGGHSLNLIQISFEDNQMTLRVPVSQAGVCGLRKIATREAMADVLVTLAGRPRVSRLLWARRAQEFVARINSGDLTVLAQVVRDLQKAADGSGSSYSQRNLFELAIDRLAGEYAAVTGVDKTEALNRLTQALRETKAQEVVVVEDAMVAPEIAPAEAVSEAIAQ